MSPFKWPTTGWAAIGSVEGGYIACSQNADQMPRPMASVAKLFAVGAILEKLGQFGFGQQYTLRAEEDVKISRLFYDQGGVVMPLDDDVPLTLRDAIWLIVNASVNNVTQHMLEIAFGSTEDYLWYVRNMLARMGLYKTIITDPCGFDSETMSTPPDLVAYLATLLRVQPEVATIMSESHLTVLGVEVANRNRMLSEGVIGKTGFTNAAGRCFAFAAPTGNRMTTVGAILGAKSPSRLHDDTLNLLLSAR